MNTKTHLAAGQTSHQNTLHIATLGTLFTLASISAHADKPPALVSDTRTAKVSLIGLDLSTPEGTHAALERIKTTAEHLCIQLSDSRKVDDRAVYAACVNDTFADTVRRLNAPNLAALLK